jgi:hypothetical protein
MPAQVSASHDEPPARCRLPTAVRKNLTASYRYLLVVGAMPARFCTAFVHHSLQDPRRQRRGRRQGRKRPADTCREPTAHADFEATPRPGGAPAAASARDPKNARLARDGALTKVTRRPSWAVPLLSPVSRRGASARRHRSLCLRVAVLDRSPTDQFRCRKCRRYG